MKYIRLYESYNEFNEFEDKWLGFILDVEGDYNIEFLEDDYNSVLKEIKSLIFNKTKIYRKVIGDLDMNNIGVFWTSNRAIARNWNPGGLYDDRFKFKSNNSKYLIEAIIPNLEYVDLLPTIAHRIVSSEDEIRIKPESPIEVLKINDESVNKILKT